MTRVQTFAMSRAERLMTTCDQVLSKISSVTADIHYMTPRTSSNENLRLVMLPSRRDNGWRSSGIQRSQKQQLSRRLRGGETTMTSNMKSEASGEVHAALSKFINVSVPAALRTAFLLFRPDVAQRASKITSTVIN